MLPKKYHNWKKQAEALARVSASDEAVARAIQRHLDGNFELDGKDIKRMVEIYKAERQK